VSRRDDGPALETRRLLLRPWSDDDFEPFAALNADPRVMEHFPALMDRATSDAQATRWRAMFAEHGLGMWAAEEKDGAPFIGFIGLSIPAFEAAFTPCVEVGWLPIIGAVAMPLRPLLPPSHSGSAPSGWRASCPIRRDAICAPRR